MNLIINIITLPHKIIIFFILASFFLPLSILAAPHVFYSSSLDLNPYQVKYTWTYKLFLPYGYYLKFFNKFLFNQKVDSLTFNYKNDNRTKEEKNNYYKTKTKKYSRDKKISNIKSK